MDANPPFNVVSGKRRLAVIMFTDAVAFSARMHEQEVPTLHRIEQDMEAMRASCETHAGTVLKTTGDGLLIQFASAVQAVTCALEIQRTFAARTETPGSPPPLRHRIGIHLGDVFASEGDLMGDGVNVAARLMGEAPPGGIVISQMVHDVVRNKMPLHLAQLGPRQLKNIKEPVTVYRVLLEAPTLAPAPRSATSMDELPRNDLPETPPSRRLLLTMLAAVVVTVAAWALWREKTRHERELVESQSAQAALDELLRKGNAARPKDSHDETVSRAPEWRIDFAAALRGDKAITLDAEALRRAAEIAVQPLLDWLPPRLAAYTRDHPLVVRSLGDASFTGATIYGDANGQLVFAEGRAVRTRPWADLRPDVQAAIIAAALRDASPPPPPEVTHGAEAFAYLHRQPAMVGR